MEPWKALVQELLDLAAPGPPDVCNGCSEDTPAVPTPLWLALIFGGCMTVVLQLGMAAPSERLFVHGLMLVGAARVVAASLLIVYFLDHRYGQHTDSLQPTAMHHTPVMVSNLDSGLRSACTSSGRLV